MLLGLLVLSGFTSFAQRAYLTHYGNAALAAKNTLTSHPREHTAAPARAKMTSTAVEVLPNAETLEPAQSGGSYTVTQEVIAGGGGTSANGATNVTGSIGQSAAVAASGGSYTVSSGFWGGGVSVQCSVITINPVTLPVGAMGAFYQQTFTQTGGTGAISYSLSAGSLPSGLNLSAAGVLSGTSTQAGNFSFIVKATDANGCTGTQPYTLTLNVVCPALTIAPATLTGAKVGTPLNQMLTASGGVAPYTFAVTAGALPNGASLTPQGLLSGTPTAAGNFSFTVTATDANGCQSAKGYSFTVSASCNPLTVSPATLAAGMVGANYTSTLTAVGGAPAYNFSVSAGVLPAGLNLSSAGVLAGTPVFAGTFAFTAQALDANGCAGSQAYSLVITPRTVTSVSAASYLDQRLTSEMIVAGFGVDLAPQVEVAMTLPLPTELLGTTVRIRDSQSVERLAPLFYASPAQVNYQIPPGTALGPAHVTITNTANLVSEGEVNIVAVAPGLFAANANGAGVAAALAVRVKADDTQSYEPVAQYDATTNQQIAVALNLGPASEQVFLLLFGTGMRGRSSLANVTVKIGNESAEVFYAGAHCCFVGVDQVNVKLPRSLSGSGEVEVTLMVDGLPANKVTIKIE